MKLAEVCVQWQRGGLRGRRLVSKKNKQRPKQASGARILSMFCATVGTKTSETLPKKVPMYRFTPHYEGFTTYDEIFAPHDKGFTPHDEGVAPHDERFTPIVVLWHCVKT